MQEALDTFGRLISVEDKYIDTHVAESIKSVVSQSAARGMLQSSAAMLMVFKEVTRAVPIEAQMALTTLLRCLTAHGEQVRPENLDSVKTVLGTHIDKRLTEFYSLAIESAPLKNVADPSPYSRHFLEVVDAEKARIWAELDLISAASTHVPPQPLGTAPFIFNGPVGLVQTGAGSFGSSVQTVDASTRDSILAALNKIEALISSDADQDRQLLDLVRAASEEAKKDSPNPHLLKSLASGVGSAISTLPKLREGYESIKWALGFAGITLP